MKEELTVTEGVVEAPTTEAPETAAETKRGRPRSQETLARDAQILEAIRNSPTKPTRESLAAATGLEGSKVYLSLFRLQRDGQVVRSRDGGQHVWSVKTDEAVETPEVAPAPEAPTA